MAKFLGGLIPTALSGGFGKENRGFGLGLLPGLLYKDRYKKKQGKADEIPMTAAEEAPTMKKGGKVKKHAKGGVTRGDGICKKGHTKGKMV
jgi:hypothetical protein